MGFSPTPCGNEGKGRLVSRAGSFWGVEGGGGGGGGRWAGGRKGAVLLLFLAS